MNVGILVGLVLVGALAVLAIWDGFRRAIAADVRRAELRVEAQRRHEVAQLAALITTLRSDVDSLTSAIAFGKTRRP